MAYEKQTWVTYDGNKSEEENIQNGAVGTAQRFNHIETGIEAADQLADKHIKDKSNPHSTTAAQVGLGSISNYGIATINEATAGTANNKYMTPFLVSEALKTLQAIKTVNGKTGDVVLGKNEIGLDKVDNLQQATKVEFNTHVNSKNNPHQVTAAQLSVYTITESDTKFQGYQSTPIIAQDWNTITQPGVYYVNNATGANKPDKVTTMYGFLEVIKNQFSTNAIVHRFISFNNEMCTRRYSGNPITWGTWESTVQAKDVVSIGDFNNTVSELTSQIDEIAHDTGWVTLPVLKGSGSVKVRTYMGRTLLWFDSYIWNGNGTNAPDDAVVTLPTEFQTGRMQMFEVPIWIGTPGMSDRYQLNADGRLYKLSNNSKTTSFRTFTEIF